MDTKDQFWENIDGSRTKSKDEGCGGKHQERSVSVLLWHNSGKHHQHLVVQGKQWLNQQRASSSDFPQLPLLSEGSYNELILQLVRQVVN